MQGDPLSFLTVEFARGSAQCLALGSSVVIPANMGVIFKSSDGRYWQQALQTNADGSTYYDESGLPVLQMTEVTL